MIEVALILVLLVVPFFFLYTSLNLQEEHTTLKLLFFLLSIMFIYTALVASSQISQEYTSYVLANTTYSSTTGITEYNYTETHPYEKVGNMLLSLTSATGYVLFFVLAYFIVMLLFSIYKYLTRYVK